jgi:hypothetical protein
MNPIAFLLPLLFTSQGTAVPTNDPLLRAVPKDAVFVASIPRVAELRARAAENAWVKMLRDPLLAPMWQSLSGEGSELSVMELGRLDGVLAELDGLCVFVEPGPDGVEIGLLLAPGPERAELDRWLDHLMPGRGVVDRAAQDGLEIEVRELEDSGSATHLAHLELAGLSAWLQGAGRARVLERAREVAARWNSAPGSECILASERLADARRDAGARPAIELYADLGAIVQRAIEEDPPDETGAKILAAIHVQGLSWARGGFDVGAGERFDLELAAKLPDQGFLRTWAGFLGPAPKGLARRIPRDVSSVSLGRIDLNGIYRSVLAMLEEAAPAQFQEMRAGVEMLNQSIGVDIEADILDQLTGDYASFVLAEPQTAGEGELHSGMALGLTGMILPRGMMTLATTAYMIGLKDPGIVEQAFSDLLATAGVGEVDVTEHGDFEVSSIPIEGDFGPRWAFLDDHVLVAVSDGPIDAALGMHAESAPPSVLDHPLLRPALDGSAGEACVSVADTRAWVRTMIALFTADSRAFAEFEVSVEEEVEGGTPVYDVEGVDASTPDAPEATKKPELAGLARHFSGVLVSTIGTRGGVARLRFYGR